MTREEMWKQAYERGTTDMKYAIMDLIIDCNSDGLKGIFCDYDAGVRFRKYVNELTLPAPQFSVEMK